MIIKQEWNILNFWQPNTKLELQHADFLLYEIIFMMAQWKVHMRPFWFIDDLNNKIQIVAVPVIVLKAGSSQAGGERVRDLKPRLTLLLHFSRMRRHGDAGWLVCCSSYFMWQSLLLSSSVPWEWSTLWSSTVFTHLKWRIFRGALHQTKASENSSAQELFLPFT